MMVAFVRALVVVFLCERERRLCERRRYNKGESYYTLLLLLLLLLRVVLSHGGSILSDALFECTQKNTRK